MTKITAQCKTERGTVKTFEFEAGFDVGSEFMCNQFVEFFWETFFKTVREFAIEQRTALACEWVARSESNGAERSGQFGIARKH